MGYFSSNLNFAFHLFDDNSVFQSRILKSLLVKVIILLCVTLTLSRKTRSSAAITTKNMTYLANGLMLAHLKKY